MTGLWPSVAAVASVVVMTLAVGAFGLRISRTTSDFFVAGRAVRPLTNASAIGGEYLSAASFLGVAGLVLAYGSGMLWYPVGYTAGYLVLLVCVAAPLRRSGAYTLPDFAEDRLDSRGVRLVASLLVVGIGWLYLVPQLVGAGLTLRLTTGAPQWAGGVLVSVAVVLAVVTGGMRSITLTQAVQYWVKLTALAFPLVVLLLAWHGDGTPGFDPSGRPVARTATTVTVSTDTRVMVTVPATVDVDGILDGVRRDGDPVRLTAGSHLVSAGTVVTLPAGAVVPRASTLGDPAATDWARPLASTADSDHPLYGTWSLLLGLLLGTMGLPHVLVRFYTNPDGRSARRTTLAVLGLLGLFYLLPAAFGALARVYTPDLLLTGQADGAVLLLPTRLVPGLAGQLLAAVVVAGAFAAFLSTSSGLTLSVAGVLSQDLLRGGVRDLRVAAVLAVPVPLLLSLVGGRLPVADAVGLAFAVAASSFCPLLVLGVWWRRLTAPGAVAGLVVGGGLAITAVVITVVRGPTGGWGGVLLSQPAAWTVPIAFVVMVVVSLATADRVPAGVAATMARLHAPESVPLHRPDRRRTDRSSRPPGR